MPLPKREGDWSLWATAAAEELLARNSLLSGVDVMALRGGEIMRSVPGRSTTCIELRTFSGGPQIAYLKRYERDYLGNSQRLLRRLGWPAAGDEALHEWNALWQLRSAGFCTAQPLAAGQMTEQGCVTRSFLLTAEIEGGIAAHEFSKTLSPRRRRQLALSIATLTGDFIRAGFAHRDYYLSHIFVVEKPGPVPWDLYLIDLQRVFRPRWLAIRWMIKDLGALAYTARLVGWSRPDLSAFYHACFQRQRLTGRDKMVIHQVARRVAALQRRNPKYDVIWDQPGVRPPNV